MLVILNPLLEFVNFFKSIIHYILVVSFLIGKGLFAIAEQFFTFCGTIFQGFIIVFEELWLFLRELHVIINEFFIYMETSANRGVAGMLDGIALVASEFVRFLTNGKLHSKILASTIGRWVANFFEIFCGGLILISDCVWFILTIVPRCCFDIAIWIGDIIAFGIGGSWMLLVQLTQNVIDELFRYTIALVVIAFTVRNRRRIYRAGKTWTVWVFRFFINWMVKIYRFIFVLQPPRPAFQTHRLPITSPSSMLHKSNESNCCVVCRDRPKCVLLLPCKHLCMCEECAEFINGMRQTFCPLCRSSVNKQLSVYV